MAICNRQDHPSSRSPIVRASRLKSPRARLVLLGLLFLLLPPLLLTMPAQAQVGTPTVAVPSSYFGMMFNNYPTSVMWPLAEPVNYGFFRVWDSNGAQWPEVETASGTFDWSFLRADLKNVANNSGAGTPVLYTMNRTPNWALGLSGNCTSTPDQPACDTSCNDYGNHSLTTGGSAPGQCYPPADLNPDGSGTDATWKAWVTALSTEAVSDCASGNKACIQYYEIWNEIHRNAQGYSFPNQVANYPTAPYLTTAAGSGNSYYGSYAQLVRMLQDAKCIIQGKASLLSKTVGGVTYPNAIDNAGGAGVPASCTVSPGLQCSSCTYPAKFVAPSVGTAPGESQNTLQNFLYCSVTGVQSGSPNWCNTNSDASNGVGFMNFHMKPGNFAALDNDGTDPYLETEMLKLYCNVMGSDAPNSECASYNTNPSILQTNELDKPFWNGESGWSGASTDTWDSSGQNLSGSPDMQASFIARYALVQWALGIQSLNWYEYDIGNVLNGSSENGSGAQAGDPASAFSAIYTWMVGQTMDSTGCVNVANTRWNCNFTGPSGYVSRAVWDTSISYDCNSDSSQGNDCTYYWSTLDDSWTYYRDLWGNETAIPSTGTHAHQVQVSNLPILLENQKL